MTRRGSYAKGIAKREEILTTALELIARNGYSRATVRELAEAVGLSQAGLLHHFGSKEELFAEILRRRDEVDARAFGDPDDLPDAHTRLIHHNTQVPGLVQLYARFSAEATEPTHPAHAFFRRRFRLATDAATDAIAGARDRGDLPADVDPAKLAVLLAALTDGLQTYWMYDPDVDMADIVAHFWSLIRREPAQPQ